jgi:hypothetical protein
VPVKLEFLCDLPDYRVGEMELRADAVDVVQRFFAELDDLHPARGR